MRPDFSRILTRFSWAAILLVLAACAAPSSPYEDWPNSENDGDEAPLPDDDPMPRPPGAGDWRAEDGVDGPWAIEYVFAYFADMPVLGRVQLIMSAFSLLDITKDQGALTLKEHTCSYLLPIVEDVPLNLIFPEAAIEAFPERQRNGSLAALEAGAAFGLDETIDFFGGDGSRFADPAADPLPTDPDDPRVVDLDADDHPGMTLRTTGVIQGEVYVMLRVQYRLEGALVNFGRIEGRTFSTVDMATLDGEPALLAGQIPLSPIDDPELNRFQIVRLSVPLDCAELLAQSDELFTYDPLDYAEPLD
ncbi:MAG: hypothetical protein C4523_15020 [Myxococcales bacterium]|nr:MAG: hypothetical protein C4523_15020 [Myxococcales bacterium]